MNSSNSVKSFSSRMVPSIEWRISLPSVDIKDHSFSPNSKIELLMFDSNYYIGSVKKRSFQDKGNFIVFFHFKNNKIDTKGEFTTSTSIFSAIPTGHWNDRSANLTLILVGLRVLRDTFAYKEYGMRLMLAPRLFLILPSNWFPLIRVKWLPLMANSFTVSRMVIAEPEVRATTQSAAHIGRRQLSVVEVDRFFVQMELFYFVHEVFDSEYILVQVMVRQVQSWKHVYASK
ncbi:hypothetical protein Tco_0928405 [Tanacetum coccineum]